MGDSWTQCRAENSKNKEIDADHQVTQIPFRLWSAITWQVRWLAINVTSFTSGSLLLLVSSCAPSSHTTVVTNLHNYSHVLLCKLRHTVWDGVAEQAVGRHVSRSFRGYYFDLFVCCFFIFVRQIQWLLVIYRPFLLSPSFFLFFLLFGARRGDSWTQCRAEKSKNKEIDADHKVT